MLISWAVTAQLICVFVFAYAKSRVYRDAAQIIMVAHFFEAKLVGKLFLHKIYCLCQYCGKTHLTNFLIILNKTDINTESVEQL